MSTKKTKAQLKAERRAKRHYGMVQLPKGKKFVWLSQQNKFGWSLGLALESHTCWLRNVRFATRKDVEQSLGGTSKVVFVELKK